MQAMAADQRKEGGEKCAPRWACPAREHAHELVDLKAEKPRTQYPGCRHRTIEPGPRCIRAPMLARPQVKLESSRQAVLISTLRRLNSSRPLGPPAVAPTSTAYVAKKAENMMMSLSRKIQKP